MVDGESLGVGEGDGVVAAVGAGGDGPVAVVDGAVVVAAEEDSVGQVGIVNSAKKIIMVCSRSKLIPCQHRIGIDLLDCCKLT